MLDSFGSTSIHSHIYITISVCKFMQSENHQVIIQQVYVWKFTLTRSSRAFWHGGNAQVLRPNAGSIWLSQVTSPPSFPEISFETRRPSRHQTLERCPHQALGISRLHPLRPQPRILLRCPGSLHRGRGRFFCRHVPMEPAEDSRPKSLWGAEDFQVDFTQLLGAVICKRPIPMSHQRCENLSLILSEVRKRDEHQSNQVLSDRDGP